MIKKFFIVIALLLSFFSFYKINENNYEKHNEIKKDLVDHPENLPKKEVAKATSFGFENLKADYYWLKTIQYIGGNAYHSEYKKYLYAILDLITELNPFFESPYIIGELLLPAYEARYEFIDENEQKIHTDEAIKIGLKGVKNFCNLEKIELIENEDDLLKVWNSIEYKNPCLSYQVPFYLAYIYWFYLNKPLESAKYYKVASACENAPEGAKTMAAIMPSKGGNREKSFFMFLTLANFVEPDNEVCNLLGNELSNLGTGIFTTKEITLNSTIIENIEKLRSEAFGNIEEDPLLRDTKCSNYINKAVRELNLEYIDQADAKYQQDNGTHSWTAKDLYDLGYIDYLPIDFQQYEDYGIIYIFNEDVGNYDYKMGRY